MAQDDATFALHAMMWRPDGSMAELPGVDGGTSCSARWISSTGHIAGTCLAAGNTLRPVVREAAGGAPVELPLLPGAVDAFIDGINAAGAATGQTDPGLGSSRAVVWRDGSVFDLQQVTSGLPDGVTLEFGGGIADDGSILAWGADTAEGTYVMILAPDEE